MCAINGLLYGSKKEIHVMNALTSHRGPDKEGIYIDSVIGFGHNRLSIIDISDKATQPMWNKDKTLCIVFNGEIYNFLRIQKQLQSSYSFKSESDTEVILSGYERWGSKIIEKLEGMFAIVIYDRIRKTLFLARDRFGEKPLYYIRHPRFGFSSEIKSLLPFVQTTVCKKSFDEFMTQEHTFKAQTLFTNIFELVPGYWLEYSIKTKHISTKRYWEIPQVINTHESSGTLIQWIKENIPKIIQDRLIGDVPIGTYLSGGIDSSAITAFASKMLPYKAHSFCLIYKDTILQSEKSFMDTFLKKYTSVKSHFVFITAKKFWDNFVHCTWINDYPLVFPADVAQFLLAKKVQKKVKVALSGQGGDELFGGYGRHWMSIKSKGKYQDFGSIYLYKFFQMLSCIMNRPMNYYANRFFSPEISQMMTINYFHEMRKKKLYGNQLRKFIQPIEYYCPKNSKNQKSDYLTRYLVQESKTYLRTVLHHQDRMNMAGSVESRAPFLDNHFVKRILSIPQQYKVTSQEGKLILKKAMTGILPEKILNRQKVGFSVPLKNWLSYIHWGKNILTQSLLARDRFFSQQEINQYIFKKDEKGVYFLLAIEVWYRLFIEKQSEHDILKVLLI